MSFDKILHYIKNGWKVSREGWNGKNMFLLLIPGSTFKVGADRPIGIACPELIDKEVNYRPHIDMKTVDGEFVPWVASQTDLLAEDWFIV